MSSCASDWCLRERVKKRPRVKGPLNKSGGQGASRQSLLRGEVSIPMDATQRSPRPRVTMPARGGVGQGVVVTPARAGPPRLHLPPAPPARPDVRSDQLSDRVLPATASSRSVESRPGGAFRSASVARDTSRSPRRSDAGARRRPTDDATPSTSWDGTSPRPPADRPQPSNRERCSARNANSVLAGNRCPPPHSTSSSRCGSDAPCTIACGPPSRQHPARRFVRQAPSTRRPGRVEFEHMFAGGSDGRGSGASTAAAAAVD